MSKDLLVDETVTKARVKLESNDGELFEVDLEVAKMSETIKTMYEDMGLDENDEEPIPIRNVNGVILKMVIEWAEHHLNDSPEEAEEYSSEELKRSDNISIWDVEFLKVDTAVLFELVMAANYLHIKGLLQVASKTIANLIKGKSPEEIRDVFNVPHPDRPDPMEIEPEPMNIGKKRPAADDE